MSRRTVNILFLGGAKRVSMARMLIEAGRVRDMDVRIYSYELSRHVPVAAVAAGVVEGLRWADPRIYESLLDTIRSLDIRIVIPFVDPAVGIAARLRERYFVEGSGLEHIFVPVSSPALCDVMFDKSLAAEMFERLNIPIPATYSKGRPEFPLIAKPVNGSASKGIKVINSTADFRSVISPPGIYLIQEYIPECREYTVDCYVSASGQICAVSPRLRIEVIGGEVSRTATVLWPELDELSRTTLNRTGLRGAVTIQILHDTRTGRLLLMEINPRLGGGAVCSVHAGVDIPGMILDEYSGIEPQPAHPEPDVEIVRYLEEVVFRNGDKQ